MYKREKNNRWVGLRVSNMCPYVEILWSVPSQRIWIKFSDINYEFTKTCRFLYLFNTFLLWYRFSLHSSAVLLCIYVHFRVTFTKNPFFYQSFQLNKKGGNKSYIDIKSKYSLYTISIISNLFCFTLFWNIYIYYVMTIIYKYQISFIGRF